MSIRNKQKRTYKRITRETVAHHKAMILLKGNGTKAIRDTDEDYDSPKDRAYRIAIKSEDMLTGDYIENSLQQIANNAVQVLGELVNSSDEAIATRNVHYAIDHVVGKAVQRSENKNVNINIESVLA